MVSDLSEVAPDGCFDLRAGDPVILACLDELRAGLREMGIGYVSQEGRHLPMLNAVKIPDGVEDLPVRKRLLDDFGLEIGGGLGAFKGKAWRIGLMGHASTKRNVALVLAALRAVLK